MREQAILEDALRPQRIAPMDQHDGTCKVGEIKRLLDGGISATNYCDLLVAEEEAVASGTC